MKRISFVLIVVAAVLFGLCCGVAHAATVGTGAWYWPTGTEDFGGMGPWWQFRSTRWHLAQDMALPAGRPIVAIGDGTVLESQYVGGYGRGGTKGGAVVILHKTAAGTEFKALYGHLYSLRFDKGDKVTAGAVIGLVNTSSPNHVHFGIHPGRAYPSDNNPYRGHTYTSSKTYGWVNPVTFLRNNPRVIPYVAPPLPTVVSMFTTSTPLSVRVAGGVAWWGQSVEGTSTMEWWRYALRTGPLQLASAEDTIPAGETVRYRATASSSPAGFTLVDRTPVLTVNLTDATPVWKRPVTLKGTVTNANRQSFQGATVTLERYLSGAWKPIVSGIANRSGAYSLTYTPSSRSDLRTSFTPPGSTYTTASSAAVVVIPHAAITRPALSVTSPTRARTFSATSLMVPRRSTSSVVYVRFERKVGTAWVSAGKKRARLTDTGSAMACRVAYACASRGSWRARTTADADSKYAKSWSTWSYFTVK